MLAAIPLEDFCMRRDRPRSSDSLSRSRWLVALGASAVTICTTLTASGDPITFPECTKEPTAQDVEGAKGAHRAAAQWFDKADYDRAIQYWRDAYSLDCTKHALLLNIASAYEKKGEKQSAIETLEVYLTRAPNAPDAATISEKVINLKNSMKTAPPPTASGSAAPPPPPPTGTTTEPPPPPPTAGGGAGIAPWIVVGAGGDRDTGRALHQPVGRGAHKTPEAPNPTPVNCSPDVEAEGNGGRTKATIGGVAIGVGVAAIAGGLVWKFVFDKPAATTTGAPASERFVGVAPAAGPQYGGVALTGAF